MIDLMHNEMQNSFRSESALVLFLEQRLAQQRTGEITLICAGHFMLVPDRTKKKLMPGIFEKEFEDYNFSAQNLIGCFPQYTWRLGCIFLKKFKERGSPCKILLLINDWQLVPPDITRDKSKPNRFREDFYTSFKELPKLYNNEFNSFQLDFKNDIFWNNNDEFYFREVRLRDRFTRKMKPLLAEDMSLPVGMCTLDLDEGGDICLNSDTGSTFSLTVNSKAGCAAGVSQMIIDVAETLSSQYNKINFINLMPWGCTYPVNVASELSISLLGEKAIKSSIINIFFESSGISKAEEFYNTGSHPVTSYEFVSSNNLG